MKQDIIQFAAKYRTFISRILVGFLFIFIFISEGSWSNDRILALMIDVFAFILILICTFGRLWASIYICGYKEEAVISSGPYSMVRHPLYFFSFMGVLGLCLTTGNSVVTLVIMTTYIIYYPLVILDEEATLKRKLGKKYEEFIKKTPRFIPNPALFKEPEHYTVYPKIFRRSLMDIVWFMGLYMILRVINI